ncbi:MAG: hypothetical protein O2923_01365 [Verrucomicrobia bacterium]|nr:hypothetical protein [Verrucomicrobiota bacterium]MDA1085442.1 hypothetical protein [Verrucomicrobiota bacterium]
MSAIVARSIDGAARTPCPVRILAVAVLFLATVAAPAEAGLLQGLRGALSDWMFIQTETYLDHGIASRPGVGQASADGSVHPMASCATVIPDAARDYRGFVGRLHRLVQPWPSPESPHQHAEGPQLVSWFRLMTWVNPHSIRGYTTGAYWLEAQSLDAATRFLDEGGRNNPQAFQIHFMRAGAYLEAAKQDRGSGLVSLGPQGRKYLDAAMRSYRTAAELTLAQRPRTDEEAARLGWTAYDELDSRAALRMAVILERRFGSMPHALEDARRFLAALGDDPVLPQLISDYEEGKAGPDAEIETRSLDPHEGHGHAE